MRAMGVAAGALFAAFGLVELWQLWHLSPAPRSDFFGLWAWSRYLAEHGVAGLYDPAAQLAFQQAIDPAGGAAYYPFLYPPTYLLVIWSFGHWPEGVARAVWSAATLALYLAAVRLGRWRTGLAGLAAVAPATVLCLFCGQNGLLTAGLLLGGLRLAPGRPWVGGVLLGMLSVKPHLALLVPVALVATGNWRALAAAAGSALAVAGVAAAVFGMGAWGDWVAARAETWAAVDAFVGERLPLVPTVSAGLREVGAGPAVALAGQMAAALAAMLAVAALWRRSTGAVRVFGTAVATLLTTPYAFLYDLPMVSGGALLLVQEAVARRGLRAVDLGFVAAVLLLPQLMFGGGGTVWPMAAPVLGLTLLWVVVRRDAMA